MVAKYKLVERCFLKTDDSHEAWMHEAGAEILFSGIPGRSFEPLNDEARAAMGSVPPVSFAAANILPRRGRPASRTDTLDPDRSI
jgi:hypothetical protein